MKKADKLLLAQKNGVQVVRSCSKWYADITDSKYTMGFRAKLSTLIRFLADNKIKINN